MMKKFAAVAAVTGVLVLGGAGVAAAQDVPGATGTSNGSVVSGNNVQIPVNVPINVCGNPVNALSVLTPAAANGNTCSAS